jgi:hypothetical protein
MPEWDSASEKEGQNDQTGQKKESQSIDGSNSSHRLFSKPQSLPAQGMKKFYTSKKNKNQGNALAV